MSTGPGDAWRSILGAIEMDSLTQIDAGVEGRWADTVVTVWTPADGLSLDRALHLRDPERKPSLELMFPAHWVGVHCFTTSGGGFALDADAAKDIIAYVADRFERARR